MGNGTKLSYLIGIVLVVGAIIYHNTSKRLPPSGTVAPPTAAQAAAPARDTTGPLSPAVPPPATKKRGKEMTEEDRNRFNENLTKADDEQRNEERKLFEKRLNRAGEGSKTAQYDVGIMYLKGTGTEPDRDKACEWLDKSAAQNHPPAFSGLGDLEALAGNRDKAVAHFVQAGRLSVEGFLEEDEKAMNVVYHALEQLEVLGAGTEHAELAAKTTMKDEPKTEPESPDGVAPDTPKSPEAPVPPGQVPEPTPVLDLPPLPDPPPAPEQPPEPEPPPPAPDAPAPPGEIKAS